MPKCILDVSETEPYCNKQDMKNNTLFKTQLHKSLTHVNQMLADIEGKIENERKILSQIDYDLNYKDQPSGFLDYEVTDIWWQSPNSANFPPKGRLPIHTRTERYGTPHSQHYGTPHSQQHNITETRTNSSLRQLQQISDIVSDWVHNMATQSDNSTTQSQSPTTPSTVRATVTTTLHSSDPTTTTVETTLFPRETIPISTLVPSGVPSGWPFEHKSTTAVYSSNDSLLVQELKETLARDQTGYFTVGLTKFLELVTTKDPQNISPILDGLEVTIGKMMEEKNLETFGPALQSSIRVLLGVMNNMSPTKLQQQAGVGHYVLKNKNVLATDDINECLDMYDSMFEKSEGEDFFKSLDDFNHYPDGGKPALEVSQNMLTTALIPYLKSQGTRKQRKLVASINAAILAKYPNWQRSMTLDDKFPVEKPSNKTDLTVIPSRRRMGHSFKKIMRHFYKKHPKLFKRMNKHHKYNRRRKHHHHKSHHHSHKKHRNHMLNLKESLTESLKESLKQSLRKTTGEKEAQNAFEAQQGLVAHETVEFRVGHVTQNAQLTQDTLATQDAQVTQETLDAHVAFQTFNLQVTPEAHDAHIAVDADSSGSGAFYRDSPKNNELINKVKELNKDENKVLNDKKYFKQLAKRFGVKLKPNPFRRFMGKSSENKPVQSSQFLQDSLDKNIVHKIREASSYSDEETHLRTNLYDALRHGNRTFVHFRNNSFKNLASDLDEELVIKNNLYKVLR